MGFDLKRTPGVGALQAIITCDDLLVCDTHFYRGRTAPCERLINDEGKTIDESPCAACLDKASYRTHVYLSAFIVKNCEHFIFECTSNAAKALDDYRKATGSLRGCIMYASRPKGLKNSKVVIETNTANLSKVKLPPAPDLERALAVIWRIPTPALETVEGKKNGRITRVNGKLRAKIEDLPDNMPEAETIGDFIKKERLT